MKKPGEEACTLPRANVHRELILTAYALARVRDSRKPRLKMSRSMGE